MFMYTQLALSNVYMSVTSVYIILYFTDFYAIDPYNCEKVLYYYNRKSLHVTLQSTTCNTTEYNRIASTETYISTS